MTDIWTPLDGTSEVPLSGEPLLPPTELDLYLLPRSVAEDDAMKQMDVRSEASQARVVREVLKEFEQHTIDDELLDLLTEI